MYISRNQNLLKKLYLLALTFFLLCNVLHGQEWLWKGGGTGLDECADVAYSNSVGVVSTGYYSGSASIGAPLSSTGLSDMFVMVQDQFGSVFWSKSFGGPFNDRSNAVAIDNQGNIYITGSFTESATFDLINVVATDSADVFVAKLNPSGVVQWVSTAGGVYSESSMGIDIDTQGNPVITGTFRGESTFGTTVLTSMNSPTSGAPSSDVFIAKLNSAGVWQWAKKGSAPLDDTGLDIATDPSNNIYVCGRYSETIEFDVIHPSTIQNAGFVVKLNPSGTEQWFGTITASQVNAFAIDVKGTDVLVGGESIGQLVVTGTNSSIVPTTWARSAFLVKFTAAGAVTWATEDGSNSYVSCRDVSIGPANEIYMAGIFECILDEYSDELGEGLFNSSGFRDVFVSKYSATGEREWMGQSGGPREDHCAAVSAGSEVDKPFIAGSFEKFFHTSRDQSYVSNNTNWQQGSGVQFDYPNSGGSACGYTNYGYYLTVEAQGNKDIFISSPEYSTVPPFDYYTRDGGCDFGIVEPCIGPVDAPLACQDTIEACNIAALFAITNTGTNCFLGPEYSFLWNNIGTNDFLYANNAGTYTLEVTREDGCDAFVDEIFVQINEPSEPLITDSEGVNISAPPTAEPLLLCGPATVTLEGEGTVPGSGYWSNELGQIPGGSTITIDTTGFYNYSFVDENGCEGHNTINVTIVEPLDTIIPVLMVEGFDLSELLEMDSLVICDVDLINVDMNDSLEQANFADYSDAYWDVYFESTLILHEDDANAIEFFALESGTYTVTLTPYIFIIEPCPIDTIFYPEISFSFEVSVLEAPELNLTLVGDTLICPDESTILSATGAPNYQWTGSAPFTYLSPDSILVTNAGGYTVSSSIQGANGCLAQQSISFAVAEFPQPLITAVPATEVICPGDSLLLTCEAGDNYTWIGPLGGVVGNEQSIYVNIPGQYYCIQAAGECQLESNVIEAQVYTTPYITGFPSVNLCTSGMVTLYVQTNDASSVVWLPPLSGGGLSKNVFAPNVYSVQVTSCGITSTAQIEVLDSTPDATITGSTSQICPGGVATLTGPPDMAEYSWQPGNFTTQSISVGAGGSYILEVTDTNDCSNISEAFDVSIYPINPPSANDASVCYGADATLFASGVGVFWSENSSGSPVLVTSSNYALTDVVENQTYYAFSQDAVCTSLPDIVNVTVNSSSVVEILMEDTAFCSTADVILTASEITSSQPFYNWTLPNGSSVSGNNYAIPNPSSLNTGWYYLNAGNVQCSSPEDSIYLVIEDSHNQALLPEEFAYCIGDTIEIQNNLNTEVFYWVIPSGFVFAQTVQISGINEVDEGQYVAVLNGEICDLVTDSTFVRVVPYPVFELVPEDVFCDGGYQTVHGPEGYDQYLWSTGETTVDAIAPLEGRIILEVTSLPNCTTKDTLDYFIEDCIGEFPNIFTPNGDSQNGGVDFGWLRIPIDEVIIFNRWGTQIRTLGGPDFVWRGEMDNGEDASDGVYYYIVKSPVPGRQFKNTSGYIHLKR